MGSEHLQSSLLSINEIAEIEKMNKTAHKSINIVAKKDDSILSEKHFSSSKPLQHPLSSPHKKETDHFQRITTITLPIEKICEKYDTSAHNFSPISSSNNEVSEKQMLMQKKYSINKVGSFAEQIKVRPMTGDIKY